MPPDWARMRRVHPWTDKVEFPTNSIAWDFNYRGELVFLDQAKAQEEKKII